MKITELIIKPDGTFSCFIKNHLYVGKYDNIGGILCVYYCRNLNCNKQTTLRIKSAVEYLLNKEN